MANNEQDEILTEIPPIYSSDGIYVRSGYKKDFAFPFHRHREYELNLLINADNAIRIVGDSISRIQSMDMVLIGPDMPHFWKKGDCENNNVYEITIQFIPELFVDEYLAKFQLLYLKELLVAAKNGVAFGKRSVLRYFKDVEKIATMDNGFLRFLRIMELFHHLAELKDYSQIASQGFTLTPPSMHSRRITKVCRYINEHYGESLKIGELGALINMTESSFSRFFKSHTGTTPSDYITRIRLGIASRLLITNLHQPILDICYSCGFNNVSHFSRIFRKVKGMTPSEFRSHYLR